MSDVAEEPLARAGGGAQTKGHSWRTRLVRLTSAGRSGARQVGGAGSG